MFEFMTIRELYEMVNAKDTMHLDGMDYVQLQGWVRTCRQSKHFPLSSCTGLRRSTFAGRSKAR